MASPFTTVFSTCQLCGPTRLKYNDYLIRAVVMAVFAMIDISSAKRFGERCQWSRCPTRRCCCSTPAQCVHPRLLLWIIDRLFTATIFSPAYLLSDHHLLAYSSAGQRGSNFSCAGTNFP